MKRAEVRALFAMERARFAAYLPVPRVTEATLTITRKRCPCPPCAGRDYAVSVVGPEWEPGRVILAERALRLPRNRLYGILRHECGHLADPTPNEPESEARADAIAAFVCGEPVRYDARGVQTTGRGGRRPRRLHR